MCSKDLLGLIFVVIFASVAILYILVNYDDIGLDEHPIHNHVDSCVCDCEAIENRAREEERMNEI